MALTPAQQKKLSLYNLVPRRESVDAVMLSLAQRGVEKVDYELAPLMAEKLVHTYPELQETKYPEFLAANGGVLPIDSSPGPEAESWRRWKIDFAGRCDWIDEDGEFAPGSAVKLRQFKGYFARFGHRWDLTIFDLRRAAAADVPLDTFKGKIAKKAHEAWKNHHWLFGSVGHELEGLCTNPNITHMLAPFDSATGNTTRLWAGKTDADIMADVDAVIQRVPVDTIRAEYVSRMFLPLGLVQECMNRYVAATATGMVTLWDRIKDKYKGDETGQGKVSFLILNECDADLRIDPSTVNSEDGSGGSDTSGISGDFILACPAADVSQDAFVLAYPFSQESPKEDPESFRIITKTHERMGGCKMQRPKAYVLMRFGTT